MAIKHYINTRPECVALLEKMDDFFGYPNQKNTLTTASIYDLSGGRGCYMAIVEGYTLTQVEEAFLVSERPIELNE